MGIEPITISWTDQTLGQKFNNHGEMGGKWGPSHWTQKTVVVQPTEGGFANVSGQVQRFADWNLEGTRSGTTSVEGSAVDDLLEAVARLQAGENHVLSYSDQWGHKRLAVGGDWLADTHVGTKAGSLDDAVKAAGKLLRHVM